MPDDEQEVNCALGICCGGTDGKQQRALASWIRKHTSALSSNDALAVSTAILAGWDLAPKDSLLQLKQEIAAYARGFPYEEH